jgi:hypothetical protein
MIVNYDLRLMNYELLLTPQPELNTEQNNILYVNNETGIIIRLSLVQF